MSKAFTREDDSEPPRLPAPLRPPLPPGVKNYLTRDGAHVFREELRRLTEIERPAVKGQAEELMRLDNRIRLLQEILQSAVIVDPPVEQDRVRFGARVTLRDALGETVTYRIVGIDEMDLDRNWISWQSPLARALINGAVGERVCFKAGAGEQKLEILGIEY